ncbi:MULTISPECIES: nickel-responsive transcriptional regulator NikR [Allochromatium]|jgi:CopG family transcriptional regulator, nickel-responsive regulator|uniref:Putative nickel-responsive regulator n=2 Tax=Allochromatium TaxID=85072 RepID=D3RNV7_ALLVD|nr:MULTISPECIES: nickel-responsive transcriptional regulator NikR [Allochromatium]ADC61467.1 transcriptional regulator NikR, CopG family [Allochromatium vinosum DSM 180]MBK1654303.1 nickel-responsive transcriptional regulator NikR [Allochromatium vinosum]NVZ08653.1 nickel-responsive transcriptional regulator NikR [Allochromatium humboldtianum]
MSSTESTIRFTVSLPKTLLDELDRRLVNKGYASRSELVRDLIRERIVEETWERGDAEVAGVLTIVYDHHQRELTQQILDIQHRQYVHVVATTHVHLDHHNCLETIIIRGMPAEIERLSLEIGGLRGVRFAELTRASKVEH